MLALSTKEVAIIASAYVAGKFMNAKRRGKEVHR